MMLPKKLVFLIELILENNRLSRKPRGRLQSKWLNQSCRFTHDGCGKWEVSSWRVLAGSRDLWARPTLPPLGLSSPLMIVSVYVTLSSGLRATPHSCVKCRTLLTFRYSPTPSKSPHLTSHHFNQHYNVAILKCLRQSNLKFRLNFCYYFQVYFHIINAYQSD